MARRHLGIFIYGLSGGGVPRRNITLANALARRGYRVDLLVLDAQGDLRQTVDDAVRVIELGSWATRLPWVRAKRRRQFRLIRRPLAAYLAREKPDVLLSADNYANLAALAARRLSGVATPVVISQRNHASSYAATKPALIRQIKQDYPQADAIVAVSNGVRDDLLDLGLPGGRVLTIYNPVVDDALFEAARAPVTHPWFGAAGRPLILGVGRLTAQKDFSCLVRAFARLDPSFNARLMILGAGSAPARAALVDLAASLGVGPRFALHDYVPNAVPYIARADLFALSSAWEGLGNVLIEALALGVPVVSTDCPSGPSEILADGDYGRLAPVGDAAALARAMAETLAETPDRERLREGAKRFTTAEATDRYIALFDRLTKPDS